ncbi:MAG: hypothetical protein E7300_11860 [Lachnospiraceae bacterium]|nr:hypothetical protein [Lachnospiraceae bacterium]
MRKNSSLFLMELILAILVFSMASTACIQLFVKAHVLTDKSIALNQSIIKCQNLAETLYGSDTIEDDLGKTQYYDADWQRVTDEGSAVYAVSMEMKPVDEKSLLHAVITSKKLSDESVIYELPITKFVGEEAKR